MGIQDKPFAALDDGSDIDFWGNSEPKCPHCGEHFNIQENEAWYLYDDNNTHDVDCPSCGEAFQINSSANWTFSTDEQERE